MWKIPLFDLNYDSREEDAVLDVLRSRWLTMGARTKEFEERFAAYLGHENCCLALANGTAALHLALLASGIGHDDEVIISGLSFVAALNVVTLVGATPVLADSVSLTDWNADPEDIRKKVTQRTRAIIVVHFAGQPCDMDAINAIAREHNLIVIEDAAHAIGATYKGRQCGTLGDIGCFSFFSNKNLSVGEGGMIVTHHQELHDRLLLLRSHGMSSLTVDRHHNKCISYNVILPGLNYRMDEIRAALGIVQLEKLNAANERRRELTSLYHQLLTTIHGIVVPWPGGESKTVSSCHIMPILLPEEIDRFAVMRGLHEQGIQTSLHYPAYTDFTAYRDHFSKRIAVANEISSRVVTLPLYPTMTFNQVSTIVSGLKKEIDMLRREVL